MKNYFEQAYEILNEVYGGAFLKIALQRLPENAENRSLVTLLCYGTIENDARYHAAISRLTDKKPLKKHVRLILKMAMYLLEGLQRPAYATVDVAVEFSKKTDRGASAGLVNAVLRRFLREGMRIPLPEKRYERLAVQSNFPLFAVKRLFHVYGEEAEGIFARRAPVTSVRFPKGEDGAAYLENAGVRYTPSPFPNVFFAENFRRNADFDQGRYTFQSVGSVAICDMISPCEQLLDACAAPGGKSVLLSEKCASVTAGELHPQRVKLIESYAARMRRNNVTAVEKDATFSRPEWNRRFDAVLCDVPCSGYGVIADNPDILLRADERDFASLPPLQLKILLTSAEFVKPGGNLYYSTCTLFAEENDGVVSAFLKSRPDFTAEAVSSPLGGRKTRYGLQFLPQYAYNAGFYFAKLKKQKEPAPAMERLTPAPPGKTE